MLLVVDEVLKTLGVIIFHLHLQFLKVQSVSPTAKCFLSTQSETIEQPCENVTHYLFIVHVFLFLLDLDNLRVH